MLCALSNFIVWFRYEAWDIVVYWYSFVTFNVSDVLELELVIVSVCVRGRKSFFTVNIME